MTLCFTYCSCCKRAVLQRSACPHSVSACAVKPLARADVMSPLFALVDLSSPKTLQKRRAVEAEVSVRADRFFEANKFRTGFAAVELDLLPRGSGCLVLPRAETAYLSVHHVRCSFLWPSRAVAVELEIPLSGLLDSCLRLRDARARRRQLKWHAQQQHTPQQQHYSSPPRPASGQRRRDGPPPRCTPSR